MSKKALLGGVAAVLVLSAVVGGLVTQRAVMSSEPACIKPVSLLLYSEYVPAMAAVEQETVQAVLATGKIKPAKDFDGQIEPSEAIAGKIIGVVTYGNGIINTLFGPYFAGGSVAYEFTATQACQDGEWTVTLGKLVSEQKPTQQYLQAQGHVANPDK